MERKPPSTTSDEIDLYLRTYYSLLRSTGDVQVRAFEEAHAYSKSSLHEGAQNLTPDVAAFAYSAARLPACMPDVRSIVMGQSHEQFEALGFATREWKRVTTRGRRRPLRWSGDGVLAAFVTSTTDIDDLVPIVTAYQMEWNKLNFQLSQSAFGVELARDTASVDAAVDQELLGDAVGLGAEDVKTLESAFGEGFESAIRVVARRRYDLRVRLAQGSYNAYQRAAQRWWSEVERGYLALSSDGHSRRPVYFVSSNTHALNNLLGGFAQCNRDEIVAYARAHNPEGLAEHFDRAIEQGDAGEISNLSYYLLRQFLHSQGDAEREIARVQEHDADGGISTIESPGRIDVSAQLIELSKLDPTRFDPRLDIEGLESLAESNAVIINIDYPLGMAAYHHLSRLAQGAGDIRGVYVMGKAAILNGRVGDIMISTAAFDEHSQNTYLFRNCFTAGDVQSYVKQGTVLDNQKSLTVRGSFLQNRDYMGVFYRDGYTVLEMEAGPYLSAVYELVSPNRHPKDEVVHLSNRLPFELGILHYASDTPYSRRQSLLSKSLSYFGMESTYACAIAITRRILETEVRAVRS